MLTLGIINYYLFSNLCIHDYFLVEALSEYIFDCDDCRKA